MGGTEIYKPLVDIFKQPINIELPRNLYLLTDGEVFDTESIIDLIRINRDSTIFNSFGIGDGVSTELIKRSASAGRGHFSFIMNPAEIEKNVMDSLQKDYLEYFILKNAKIVDQDGNTIQEIFKEDTLAQGD